MTLLAHVSREALRANLARLATPDAVVDVRADAWGHGAVDVALVALEAGASAVLADGRDRDALVAAGIAGDRIRHDGQSLDPRAVFGLDGAAAPAMSLSGSVISTKALRAGEGVSYGYRYRATHDTRVALVSGGYAQGVVRALGGAVSVTAGGASHPILGRVAMDVCVIGIGDADLRRGQRVWFFGDPAHGCPPVSAWARATGLDVAEIVASVGVHTERVIE